MLLLLLLLLLLLSCLFLSSHPFHPSPTDVYQGGDHQTQQHEKHRLRKLVYLFFPAMASSQCTLKVVFWTEVTFSIALCLPPLSCPLHVH